MTATLWQHVLFVGFCLATTWTHAKDFEVDSTRTYHIEEVVVKANRLPKEIIPVQTMRGIELERLSVHSVADAIRYFSGVQIKDFGGIGGLKTVNIRSMGTNHVGVFYDGIELGNAQNGQIDLGRFSLDNMEAVTLYNGQKSDIFQPAKDFGSSGSIYLQSKTPDLSDDKKYALRATFKTGSFGVVNPSLAWEYRLNSNVTGAVSGEYMYTTGRYRYSYKRLGGYDTTAVRQNGDVESFRIETGLFGQITDGEWKAKLYFYNAERGLPGAVVRENLSHEDRQWDSSLFAQASLKKQIGPLYALLINGKYAYDYLHYLADPNKDASLMYVNNHYHQQESYLSVANQFKLLPCWNVVLSGDYTFNKLNADLYQFPFPIRNTALVALSTSLHFPHFKLQAAVLNTYVHDRVRTDTLSASDVNHITPTVMASYQPFLRADFYLRAFYKKIFRMPTLNDLYYTFIGNIRLKPEYTTQYNIGATYTKTFTDAVLKRMDIQADAYYIEVENKIIATPTSNQFRWTMKNLGRVEIKGVDVSLQANWEVGKNWRLNSRLSYTYQKAQDFTNPTDLYYGHQIPYIPNHSGSAILNLGYKGWDLNYSFIYTGERYEQSANILENFTPAWYTNDLSLSKSLRWKKVPLRLTAEVNNLFNQQYEVVQCYPMPGTNCKFIVTITL